MSSVQQGELGEQLAFPVIEKRFKPCAVVKLVLKRYNRKSEKWKHDFNWNGLEKARQSFFKGTKNTNYNNRFVEKIKKFLGDFRSTKKGVPDYIVIKKSRFLFVEVKSHVEDQQKEFLLNRMNFNKAQLEFFPEIEEEYELWVCIVKFARKNKFEFFPFGSLTDVINREENTRLEDLVSKDLKGKWNFVKQTKLSFEK